MSTASGVGKSLTKPAFLCGLSGGWEELPITNRGK